MASFGPWAALMIVPRTTRAHCRLPHSWVYVQAAGLSPMEAIACATRSNAELLGLGDELGTLEAGKLADLIVVDGDPLEEIAVLPDKGRMRHVFQVGRAVPRMGDWSERV